MTALAAAADPVEDPRQLAVQYDILQRQLQSVDRRLAQIEQALVEAQQAATTISSLAEANGIQESLIPVGAGVHVHARVDPSAPILLPVGAGYFTQGPAASVTEALRARVESLTRTFQETSSDAERLAQAAAAINERLNSISPQ